MNAIAEHAGVQRATVYNHFPTEFDLIDACSTHWFTENPPPEPGNWLQIQDPVHRVRRALLDMYCYYAKGRKMLGKVLRDAAVVPAMDEIRRQKWLPLMEGIIDLLLEGWSRSIDLPVASPGKDGEDRPKKRDNREGLPRRELRSSLTVALDFFTWQTLAESGLSVSEAAKLATAWVEAAAQSLD
jgi:AcrR family transcriptional regulator